MRQPPRQPPPLMRTPPRETTRRPLVVANPYPERQTGMRVVPGEKRYNEAHTRKVLIVTDSICRGVTRNGLMEELKSKGMDVDVSIRRYGGGQTHELHHHAQQNITDERPHGMILVGGTNDLSRRDGRRQLSDEEIANNLLATGEMARELGVTNVFISSIIWRRGAYYEQRRRDINTILEEGCRQRGFIFINNNNIFFNHTDGLHLNEEGTSILKSNFIISLY